MLSPGLPSAHTYTIVLHDSCCMRLVSFPDPSHGEEGSGRIAISELSPRDGSGNETSVRLGVEESVHCYIGCVDRCRIPGLVVV